MLAFLVQRYFINTNIELALVITMKCNQLVNLLDTYNNITQNIIQNIRKFRIKEGEMQEN